jgi:hypothetical protein
MTEPAPEVAPRSDRRYGTPRPSFRGGQNVAMKVPRAQFDRTAAFYRDALGLETHEVASPDVLAAVSRSVRVDFGPITLWLDQVDNYTQPELWLEILTDDVDGAMVHLRAHGIEHWDELERLPADRPAHWITSPGGIPHIVHRPDAATSP